MFNELYNTVKVRFGQGSSNQSMGDWICSNTTIKKRPFSFDGYEFQRAIADDMHPDLSVKKCSQIGLTEVQIRKALGMTTRGSSIAGIFTLPNEKMFTKIYNGRIKPVLEADEIFNPPTENQPVRRRDQIQIRDSFLYVTGCTEGDATSTSADFLMHDEVDLSPQEVLALYQSRLQNSDLQITQKFSTPTFAGYGIDKSYQLSDQREYIVQCGACNHYQIPRFEPKFIHIEDFRYDIENFIDLSAQQIAGLSLEDCYVRCEHCSRRLDLSASAQREWVATYPTRTAFRGYQVRPFSTVRLRPRYVFGQLAKYLEDGFPKGFYNTVLGESYTPANARIQRADIEACMQSPGIAHISSDVPVFMGIDIGFTCWITLSIDDDVGLPRFILYESVPVGQLEARVQELRKIYTIVQGAADRFPFEPTVDALREITDNIVMPVQSRGTNAIAPVRDELGSIIHYSASRTYMLDRVHSLITHHKVVITGYTDHKETVIAHLSDNVRDEQPDAEAVWKKISGNDHFFYSMALNLLSRRICEHMFHQSSGSTATSGTVLISDLAGAQNLGPNTRGQNRISRLGSR